MDIKQNLSELIGETPMLQIKTTRKDWEIFLKLEYYNPAGSFKPYCSYTYRSRRKIW